ncbi:MAG: YdeI/OmpD-associated family protein [Bacteroidota bacterium]
MRVGRQYIKQLEKRKGGYYYLKIDTVLVEGLSRKRATRLICILENEVEIRCGLNHLGDGNYFIIMALRHLSRLEKQLGDEIEYVLKEDPDPLGVEVPEVLTVLLQQDAYLEKQYNALTDGKKRNLIFTIQKIKDFDSKVKTIEKYLLSPK